MQSSRRVYYHFLPAEFALCAIEKRRLKVATFDDMNDPLSCSELTSETRKGESSYVGGAA